MNGDTRSTDIPATQALATYLYGKIYCGAGPENIIIKIGTQELAIVEWSLTATNDLIIWVEDAKSVGSFLP